MTLDEVIKIVEKEYLAAKRDRDNCDLGDHRYHLTIKIANFGSFLDLLKEIKK